MAEQIYAAALKRLLADEGGYSDNPRDPGGPTNYGITLGDVRRYVKADADAADVRAMTVGQAVAIYRARYWDALCCDQLPAGVDYAVFDYGVNSGISRAGKVLRRLLGLPDDAASVTPQVIAAAGKADAQKLVAAICDERLAFLRQLSTWDTFGRGWSRRVAGVRTAATAWAAGAAPSNSKAKAGAAGAVVVAGGAAAQASGWQMGWVVAIAIVVLTAVGGIAVWHWATRRQQTSPSNPSQGG